VFGYAWSSRQKAESPICTDQVFEAEREVICRGRAELPVETGDSVAGADLQSVPLAALCLSGGGIRSASTSLGVIQGLAECGIIQRFDYISSVSGGGYTASWFAAYQARHPRGFNGVVDDLRGHASNSEPSAIGFVRSHCDYLGSTLKVLPAYLSSLYLNWAILNTLALMALLIPYFLPELWRVGAEGVARSSNYLLYKVLFALYCLSFGTTVHLLTRVATDSAIIAKRTLSRILLVATLSSFFEAYTFPPYWEWDVFYAVAAGAAVLGVGLAYRRSDWKAARTSLSRALIWAGVAAAVWIALTLLFNRTGRIEGFRGTTSLNILQLQPFLVFGIWMISLILFVGGSRVFDWIRQGETLTQIWIWVFGISTVWLITTGFAFYGLDIYRVLLRANSVLFTFLYVATFLAVPLGAAVAVSIAAQGESSAIGSLMKTLLVLLVLVVFFFGCLSASVTLFNFAKLVARRSEFVSMGGFSFAPQSISI
jgi:hypothetical protein